MFLSAKLQYSFRLYKEILKILFFFSHFSLKYGAGIIVNRTLVLFFCGDRKEEKDFKIPLNPFISITYLCRNEQKSIGESYKVAPNDRSTETDHRPFKTSQLSRSGIILL